MKTCSSCKEPKDINEFGLHKGRKDGRQHHCRKCKAKLQNNWYQKNKERHIKVVSANNYKYKIAPTEENFRKGQEREFYRSLGFSSSELKNIRRRQSRINDVALAIFNDCKRSDKKKERQNNLTKTFIQNLIENGCTYCGAQKNSVRIGLDRIDNSIGHITSNVIASCIRCNLIRGNMPYPAWLVVAKGVNNAYQTGLFENWIPGNTSIK